MKEDAEHEPESGSHRRQHDVLPHDIGGYLTPEKSQHLDRGYLSDALGYIDVGEVVDDDERQSGGREYDHQHDEITAFHHVRHSFLEHLKLAYVDNPCNPGEKVVAVPVPKIDTAIIHVQKASPDGTCIIEGDEFHDIDIAVAARKTIVTCEELVSDEWIRRDPAATSVFGECVDAVVHAPFGAWPSQCYNYYDCDDAALKEYDKASKYQDKEDAEKQIAKEAAKAAKKGLPYTAPENPETFKDYLDKWIYGVKDNDELLDKIGGARLAKLKVVPGLGYAKR